MFYVVTATVTRITSEGTIMSQVPTFFLDSNVQGIVDEKHAEQIANEIINPTQDENLRVTVVAVCLH